jgi:hypothetical protein
MNKNWLLFWSILNYVGVVFAILIFCVLHKFPWGIIANAPMAVLFTVQYCAAKTAEKAHTAHNTQSPK